MSNRKCKRAQRLRLRGLTLPPKCRQSCRSVGTSSTKEFISAHQYEHRSLVTGCTPLYTLVFRLRDAWGDDRRGIVRASDEKLALEVRAHGLLWKNALRTASSCAAAAEPSTPVLLVTTLARFRRPSTSIVSARGPYQYPGLGYPPHIRLRHRWPYVEKHVLPYDDLYGEVSMKRSRPHESAVVPATTAPTAQNLVAAAAPTSTAPGAPLVLEWAAILNAVSA
jgi:hypothetical protein